MSERRKKDRYNETWTADELTSSLKRNSDKKSSRRDEKHHKPRIEDDLHHKKDKRKERRERSDEENLQKPSSSHRRDANDEGRHHRSERNDDRHRRDKDRVDKGKDRPPSHDRHKERRDDKERYRDANGSREKDRKHREKSHKSERKSTKYSDDDRKYKRDEREHNGERKRHKDRQRYEHEDDERRKSHKEEQRDKRESHRSDEYKEKNRKRRDEEGEEQDRRHRKREKEERNGSAHADIEQRERRERRHKKREGEESDDHRSSRKSRHRKEEEEYSRQRRKERENERERSRDRHSDNDKHTRSVRQPDSDATNTSNFREDSSTTKTMNDAVIERSHDEEYNYDDEEFEDYADDFEEDDTPPKPPSKVPVSSEMEELKRAIAAENERANSAQTSSRHGSSKASGQGSPYSVSSSIEGRFHLADDEASSSTATSKSTHAAMINFGATKNASRRTKAMKKALKRRKDLSNLIQLDTVSFDIIDMAPLTEYNLYIKNYGNSNTSQASTQCNDDNLEQECQTEVPEMREKWSQHPPHDVKCVGGVESAILEEESQQEERERMLSMMRNDSKRLGAFMSRACKLVEAILIEEELWGKSVQDGSRKSQLSFCDGLVPLETNLAYLQGRKVVHVQCSPGPDASLVAAAFTPASTSFSTRIDRKGVVVVWDTRKPAMPEKLLVCDANPTCCCFSPARSYILFIGTDDGCVLAYDLREPGTNHQIVTLEKTRETILRSPTYSTGYLVDAHASPIVSLALAGGEAKVIHEEGSIARREGGKQTHTGLAFQLASLEEVANLCIWVVVELNTDSELDTDMGLAPRGRIKLLKSLNVQIQPPVKSHIPDLPFRATCVQFSVANPNHFYVGTDTGHIMHCTQYSASKKGVKSKDSFFYYNELNAVSAVMDISINPFQCFGMSVILAGFDDGTLRLYLSDRAMPVLTWPFTTEGAPVMKVQWSTSRPSVFVVLDSKNKLHIWDLAIMDTGPVKTEESSNKKISHFSLSNTGENSKHGPEIAIVYEAASKGIPPAVEVHMLSPHFSQITDAGEMEQLTAFLQSML